MAEPIGQCMGKSEPMPFPRGFLMEPVSGSLTEQPKFAPLEWTEQKVIPY